MDYIGIEPQNGKIFSSGTISFLLFKIKQTIAGFSQTQQYILFLFLTMTICCSQLTIIRSSLQELE